MANTAIKRFGTNRRGKSQKKGIQVYIAFTRMDLLLMRALESFFGNPGFLLGGKDVRGSEEAVQTIAGTLLSWSYCIITVSTRKVRGIAQLRIKHSRREKIRVAM